MWKRGFYAVTMAIAAALVAVPAAAQPSSGRGMGPWWGEDADQRLERHVGFLEDRLDLTAEQVEQARDILEARHEEARTWFEANPDATRDDRQAFRKAHREATQAAISEILTAEQKEEYAAVTERLKNRRAFGRRGGRDRGFGRHQGFGRHRGFGRHDGFGPQHPGGHWGPGYADRWLNDDRLARYLELTPEQIGQLAEMRARHRGGMQQELESILSTEQKEKLDDLRGRGRDWMDR